MKSDPGFYDYWPYEKRPNIQWPGGARLAFWVAPNIEFYELDPPANPQRKAWPQPYPALPGYGIRDYGNRVGHVRQMEVLDRYGIRGSISLSTALCDHHPEIIAQCAQRDWEFFSHGIYNTRYAYDMAEVQERAIIEDSIRTACQAALCSPEFLFLESPPGPLDDWALASRLSYFLWDSMPDETLFTLARRRQLSQPDVLRAQIERMLDDPRAERFIAHFTDEWLDLRDLEATTPDTLNRSSMPTGNMASTKELNRSARTSIRLLLPGNAARRGSCAAHQASNASRSRACCARTPGSASISSIAASEPATTAGGMVLEKV